MSSRELVISSNRHETKVAILEDDQLVEVFFQRANEYSLAGSIHKGRVTRVLPGMQSAFVDLGLERDAFLYVSDFFEESEEFDALPAPRVERERDRDRDREREREPRDRPEPSPASVSSAPLIVAPPIVERQTAAPAAVAERSSSTPAASAAAPPNAVVTSGPTPPSAGGAVSSQTGPPASGFRQSHDDSDGGRRGRRSRRRRNRGRGFPESKYASEGAQDGPAVADEEAPAGEATEEEALPPIILPGETLAKYRRSTSAPAPVMSAGVEEVEEETEVEEEAPSAGPEAESEVEMAPESEAEPEAVQAAGAPAEAPAEPEAEPEAAAVMEEPEPEPVVAIAAPAAAPESEVEAAPEPLSAAAPAGMSVVPPAPTAEHPVAAPPVMIVAQGSEKRSEYDEPISSVEDALALESEDDDQEGLDASAEADEAQDRAQEAEDAEAEAESEADADDREPALALLPDENPFAVDAEAQAIEEALDALEAGGSQTSSAAPPVTASVREPQPARYQQRSGRRMRRRGRGGDRYADSDQQQQSRQEGRERQGGGRDRGDRGGAAPVIEQRTQERPQSRGERAEKSTGSTGQLSISELLAEGQEIIVQIAKEPIGQKGARITSHIALPGRYVVYMPTLEHVGVSRKIASDDERLRLKHILHAHRSGLPGGFIVRTAGEGKSEDEIAGDMAYLYNLWLDIRQKADKHRAPVLLHHDLEIVQRTLRDQLTDHFKAIWVDNEDLYESVLRFLERFQPTLMPRVKLYTRPTPIFDAFNITPELEKALRPKIWLKSGGYIVINQTEALVAIDVNTGKYVGKSNRLEDTIVKTNLEAVKEIVRQVRLRDLGGIIVVDFIDMDERKNRQKVMQALEEAMRVDRAPYKILQFNDFGLVAITRKRVKQSLERTLCSPCPSCEGAGYVKSVQTVIGEILQEAQKIARAVDGKEVVLRVHPEVAKSLKSHQNKDLEELEEVLGRPVLVVGDPTLHCERFDLA